MPLHVMTAPAAPSAHRAGWRRIPLATVPDPDAGTTPSPSPFDLFYERHADPIRRALCLALGDTDLGRDAADEALARACERWDQVAGYANPAGWAYRVGLNWARSHQRRNRWRDRRPVPERGAPAVPGDPELAEALGRLTTDHRAVVVCRYYLDWTVADTAAALDIPEGTVKSRLARALGLLQRDLEGPR